MRTRFAAVFSLSAAAIVAAADGPSSPLDLARALERRMASGDGVTLPDADVEVDRADGLLPSCLHSQDVE